MKTNQSGKKVLIVAGEASGDLHGSNLVRAMLRKDPDLRFSGIGGRELENVGVNILYPASRIAVVGALEVISHLRDILSARQAMIREMTQGNTALLILIDFPDFNLLLAAKAKNLGIPVFYYISPQVWAWRSGRVGKIGRLTNRIGVILPFEQAFYRDRGVQVDYVGHPLMDSVRTSMSRAQFLALQQIPEDTVTIGLLPGSRDKEIRSLLPIFLRAAQLMEQRFSGRGKKTVFLLPRASTVSQELLDENGLKQFSDLIDIKTVSENRYDLMAACDAVVTASGTVTLELAILGVPLITTYRLSPITYALGRLLIKVDHFSLVNLIASRQVIPELLQEQVSPENITDELFTLLTDHRAYSRMKQGLEEVRKIIGAPGASDRAATLAIGLLQDRSST